MKISKQSFLRLLNISLVLVMAVAFVACLDIPSTPDTSRRVTAIKVCTVQYGKVDSTTLKVNPKDSAELIAKVTPSESAKELEFTWLNEGFFLGHGPSIEFDVNDPYFTPDQLVVTDPQGNTQEIDIHVMRVVPPVLNTMSRPLDGDTIFATRTTPILFHWSIRESSTDKIEMQLDIDDASFSVGNLTQIKQAGFKSGKHSYRVIVTDIYGDADTLPWKTFVVVDTLEAQK